MESRKITIVSTKTQSKRVITSNATTLGELKRDLTNNGIDYSNMDFYEGLSRTELKDSRSLLPKDIEYRGRITNELVFMLTTSNKKIKSGALNGNRAELYRKIKEHSLEEACIKKYNKNYTVCKSSELEDLINSMESAIEDDINIATQSTAECKERRTESCDLDDIKKAFVMLLNYMVDKDLMSDDAKDDIIYLLRIHKQDCSEEDPIYSNDEISNMFNFIED